MNPLLHLALVLIGWGLTAGISAAAPAVSFIVETEDFDFDGGKHQPVADTMPYLGGAYAGLSAVAEIDYHDPNPNENAEYRPSTQGVALYASWDLYRDGHSVTNNHRVAWNHPGDWFNYTRTFPAPEREYHVYARLASGSLPNAVQLDEVVAGAGTANQSVTKLGEARGPASGGWDYFLFAPVRNDAGQPARVRLGGTHTLRLTILDGGSEDINYLQFVPVETESPGPCTSSFPTPKAWWAGNGNPSDLASTNHGTLTNGATYGPGRVGEAFDLDGTDDYVDTRLDVQPAALPTTTWEAWVFPTRPGGRQQILSCDDGGYDRSLLVEGTSFGVFTGWGVWTPVTLSPNQWQHLAVVFSPTNVLFYKNGERFSYDAAPSGQSTGYRLQIGRNPGFGEHFQGRIDEVAVHDRALSAAEVAAIYTAGTAGRCSDASPTRLSAERSATGIALSWPAAGTYSLQTADRLTPPVAWKAVAGTPITVNGRRTVHVPTASATEFFRLIASGSNGGGSNTNGPGLPLPDDWTPTLPVLASAQGTIQPDAGVTLSLPGGVSITVPGAAVDHAVPITITRLDFGAWNAGIARDVYRVDAGNVSLSRPALLRFPLPPARPDDPDATPHVFRQSDGQEPVELPATVDAASQTVTVATDRFSLFTVERDSSYLNNYNLVGQTVGDRRLAVPYYFQGDSMWCFAAASQMLLKYQGVDREIWDVARYFKLPASEGAALWRLWAGHYHEYFESVGQKVLETCSWMFAARFNGYLIQQLNAGRPVWVGVQNAAHAVVVVGYNANGVFIHDPSGYSIKVGTQAPLGEWQLAGHFLTWEQWKRAAFSTKLNWFNASPMPVWTIVLEGAPATPASPVSFNLRTAGVEKNAQGQETVKDDEEMAIRRPLPRVDLTLEARFTYDGRTATGYRFMPEITSFGPPETAANSDRLRLALRLHNGGVTPASATVSILLDDREIHRSAPVNLDASTSMEAVEIFPVASPYRFHDGLSEPPRPGPHRLTARLRVASQVVDEFELDMPLAPSRPERLEKSRVPEGVKLTWSINPEEGRFPLLYNIYRGRELIGATSLRQYVVAGGSLEEGYSITANAYEANLESPPSPSATAAPTVVTFVRQDPPQIVVPAAGAAWTLTATEARLPTFGRDLKLSWTPPPATLSSNAILGYVLLLPSANFTVSADGAGAPAEHQDLGIGQHALHTDYAVFSTQATLSQTGFFRRTTVGYLATPPVDCKLPHPDPKTSCYRLVVDGDASPPVGLRIPWFESVSARGLSEFYFHLPVNGQQRDANGQLRVTTGLVTWKYTRQE